MNGGFDNDGLPEEVFNQGKENVAVFSAYDVNPKDARFAVFNILMEKADYPIDERVWERLFNDVRRVEKFINEADVNTKG